MTTRRNDELLEAYTTYKNGNLSDFKVYLEGLTPLEAVWAGYSIGAQEAVEGLEYGVTLHRLETWVDDEAFELKRETDRAEREELAKANMERMFEREERPAAAEGQALECERHGLPEPCQDTGKPRNKA